MAPPFLNEKGETIAYCVEIHDVAVSKLIAGREKDFQFLKDAFSLEIISVKEFITRVRLVETMPQNAVLTDRLKKLEKYLTEPKIESGIISPIRDFWGELRRKFRKPTYYSSVLSNEFIKITLSLNRNLWDGDDEPRGNELKHTKYLKELKFSANLHIILAR